MRFSEEVEYLDAIYDENAFIRLVDVQRELAIDSIYVSVTLAPDTSFGQSLHTDRNGRLIGGDVRPVNKVLSRRDAGSASRIVEAAPVALYDILSSRAVIILGEPGIGKTTSLRHLVMLACKGSLFLGKLPMFFRLAELDSSSKLLIDASALRYSDFHVSLREQIQRGECVLFFDGLDEAPSNLREQVESNIVQMSSFGNDVYVSCRTINWRRGAFPSSFRVYECVGFSAPQRERFVARWFQENTEECSLFQRRFLSQPRLYALFRSPLLLSLTLVASEHKDFGSDVIFRS
jgi:predicted NACHT family NTPase